MAKAWRVIISAVLICVLLGVVFVVVGLITGGEIQRIMNMFNARYNVQSVLDSAKAAVQDVLALLPTA